MNSNLLIIKTKKISEHFNRDIEYYLGNFSYEDYDYISDCKNRRILFVVELNSLGYDFEILQWLEAIEDKHNFFEGSIAGIIIKSNSELYTKSAAQDIVFHCNSMGLKFIGHSVVEMTKNYVNFQTWKKTLKKKLKDIAKDNSIDLIQRIADFNYPNCNKKILALHSSSYKTSNTINLWGLVKKELFELTCKDISEIHIENGTVVDCKGCSFQTCIHYGKQHSCFYGGVMIEEVLPAIESADTIVWICPNYNDSISSNMLAVINRLTVLYRQISFHNKIFYAVIVSGSSGSDSLAKQLIGSLNINKGFILPPYFSIMETANDPLKILEIEGVRDRAYEIAKRISSKC